MLLLLLLSELASGTLLCGGHLDAYAKSFTAGRVGGFLVPALDEEVLEKELGVAHPQHRCL